MGNRIVILAKADVKEDAVLVMSDVGSIVVVAGARSEICFDDVDLPLRFVAVNPSPAHDHLFFNITQFHIPRVVA